MKFGKQIRFVAVKQWYGHYIPYKDLKRMIKQFFFRCEETEEIAGSQLEKEAVRQQCIQDFVIAVEELVRSVVEFYVSQYQEVEISLDSIQQDLDDLCESDELADEACYKIHKMIYGQLLTLYELRTFLEVNRTGARKIMKKCAKVLRAPEVRENYQLTDAEIFGCLPTVQELVKRLETMYVVLRRKDGSASKTRNELIHELHQSVENALLWKQSTILTQFEAMTFRHSELLLKPAPTKKLPLAVGIFLLLACQFLQFSKKFEFRAQRCLGIVAFCSVLWATSAVPLWLTSFSVPFLGIVCGILPSDVYDLKTVGKFIEQSTMSPTVFLTIGGFTISAALRETEMDKRIATLILRKCARNRRLFLLSLVLLNAFVAMWISNITSTMLVVGLIAPTLKKIPTNSQYAKAMLFAIAVGGNLGGMITPLASPQNAVTVEAVAAIAHEHNLPDSISFVEFFATALPFALICCMICWGLLQLRFRMDIEQVPPIPAAETDFGWRQIYVCVVAIGTVAAWISLPFGGYKAFSDFGIVGFIPVIAFYGTGVLTPSHLSDLPWNIIFLLMGGNALCKVVTESGLMQLASDLMKSLLNGMGLWVSILAVNSCVLVIDFFLTHTVSSMITLPLVCMFSAESGHLRLYAMSTCMITTASQILPVSSFPNLCCVTLQDDQGNSYITNRQMIAWGAMVTFTCLVASLSIYYGIALAYGM